MNLQGLRFGADLKIELMETSSKNEQRTHTGDGKKRNMAKLKLETLYKSITHAAFGSPAASMPVVVSSLRWLHSFVHAEKRNNRIRWEFAKVNRQFYLLFCCCCCCVRSSFFRVSSGFPSTICSQNGFHPKMVLRFTDDVSAFALFFTLRPAFLSLCQHICA